MCCEEKSMSGCNRGDAVRTFHSAGAICSEHARRLFTASLLRKSETTSNFKRIGNCHNCSHNDALVQVRRLDILD